MDHGDPVPRSLEANTDAPFALLSAWRNRSAGREVASGPKRIKSVAKESKHEGPCIDAC